MDIKIRQYAEEDVKETIAIWNEVVKEGIAFPQKETLTAVSYTHLTLPTTPYV